jgi:Protein of unknown function (DUF3096)
MARPCIRGRDGRDKPGHDGKRFRISQILLEPNAALRVLPVPGFAGFIPPFYFVPSDPRDDLKGKIMIITAAHLTPWVAIIAGILILIMPRLLNYIVAIYLIFVGLVGLNNVHHFINWH